MVKFVGMYFVLGAIAMVLYVAGTMLWLGLTTEWNMDKANDIMDWIKRSNPATLVFDSLDFKTKFRGFTTAWVLWPASIPEAITKIAQGYEDYKENHN